MLPDDGRRKGEEVADGGDPGEPHRRAAFQRDGWLVLEGTVDTAALGKLEPVFPAAVAGRRDALAWTVVRDFALGAVVRAVLASLGEPDARPVRAICFDKQPGRNWQVPWHQDLSIAVVERRDVDGFGGWSVKDGVPHVQPPSTVLGRMITLRVHLDPCPEENGALRVVPGSHLLGRLSAPDAVARGREGPARVCEVAQGGILAMRPLLLHASSPASTPSHRRVLHLEFSPDDLPGGLAWYADSLKATG